MEPQSAASSYLLSRQNEDGGWGYCGARSWTEPTAWALLALIASGNRGRPFERGYDWIRRHQRQDGGWSPSDEVRESTWVTSLALLVLTHSGDPLPDRAVEWLLGAGGRETSFTERLRARLKGEQASDPAHGVGWPWYPETAAWVVPTSFAILALARAPENSRVAGRIAEGQSFLLSRRCRDGGWNHGAEEALGYAAVSYPETTGIALLALDHAEASMLDAAERLLTNGRSQNGAGWLQLALVAHGRTPREFPALFRKTVPDAALFELARCAREGRNVLRA